MGVTVPCLRNQTVSSLLDEVIERSIDNPEKLLVAVFCMSHTLLWVYVFLTDRFVQCMVSPGHVSDG